MKIRSACAIRSVCSRQKKGVRDPREDPGHNMMTDITCDTLFEQIDIRDCPDARERKAVSMSLPRGMCHEVG
jgi:hypothetical protein